jgi:O-methyltransferase
MSNKTLQITDELYGYLSNINSEENIQLALLREETQKLENSTMISSPEQAAFFNFLIKLIQPKNILEIGTFTGYCTLAMALAAPSDCKIITCDIDKTWPMIGKKFWQTANVHEKIELKLGSAIQSLNELREKKAFFDFIFIDADKVNYWEYFTASLDLIKEKGIIAVDNVLWSGQPANPSINDFQTVAIRNFNEQLKSFPNIHYCVLPIGDGLTLVSKK